MKKTVLFLVILLCCVGQGKARVFIDGIYYNLDSEGGTAEVTYNSLKYSGDISIPANVTFSGSSYSVTSIGDRAFRFCRSLTSITIPNSVTSIRHYAFEGCSSLTSITLGNSVTDIGNWAFSECSSLTSITIPNSVTNIKDCAFAGCSSLTSIVVDAENTRYDSRNDCNAIIETLSNTLIAGCKNTLIPNSVTSIGNDAFAGCDGLTSIEIPNSITFIENWAFEGCSSLTFIVVDAKNTTYDSRDNCNAIIETSTNTLIAGCKNTLIPNSVTSIGIGAFSGCLDLTSITIPNSVTSIGRYAFNECTGLTTATIGNSVTSIGDHAFENCSSLTSIRIPNSVTSIGYGTFWNCKGLTNIKMMPLTPPSTGSDVFSQCSSLTTVYVQKGAKDAYNVEPWNEYEIVEFEDTGIAAAPTIANSPVNAPVYDLNGRRVGTSGEMSALPKGAYIVNGKKIIR